MTLPPDLPERLNNEGLAHATAGRDALAERTFRRALTLSPAYLAAAGNLANAEARRLAFDPAIRHYGWGLAISPALPALHLMLAIAEIGEGRLDAAARRQRLTIALAPDQPKAHSNQGILFAHLHQVDGAERCYRRTLACDRHFAPALVGLAQPIHAAAVLRQALALTPDSLDSLAVLGSAEQAQGRPRAAITCLRRALAIHPTNRKLHDHLLFMRVLDPDTDNRQLFSEYRRWARRHAPPTMPATPPRDRDPDRPINVGYLSADLYGHPLAFLVEDLIVGHNPRSVAPHLFAEVTKPDTTTQRLRAAAAWTSTVGLPDFDAARLITEAGIDILVCLAGHTGDNRILVAARRPAPIQVVMHDLSTSGLDAFDYWLTDVHLHPANSTEGRTETLERLESLYCHRTREHAPDLRPPPATQQGFVTFGAFANPGKLNERVLSLWARVLKAVPASRLHLAYRNAFSDPAVQGFYREIFAHYGVDSSRLEFFGRQLAPFAHLERVATVDIGLDPFPFNGGTATFEALWMGVPIVTLAGERFAARCGVTHLEQIGLSNLVAESEDAYVAIAAGLARDIGALSELRRGLRERVRKSLLCDVPTYVRSVENAYRRMWRRWCESGRA